MKQILVSDHVRSHPLFAGLTELEKDTLLVQSRLRRCTHGQMLFAQGEPVTHFYIVVRGNIQLFRTNRDGREKTMEVLKSGGTMCECEIMDSCRAHRVNAVAVEDSVLLEFPLTWLKQSARQYEAFTLNLLSLISQHSYLAEVEAEHLASMSSTQLVACFMQRICILYDLNPKGFELPYAKTLIASRLGMSLETFSRTLVTLRDHGITVEGTRVEITDLHRVQQYVCGFCSVAEDCAAHQAIGKEIVFTHEKKA